MGRRLSTWIRVCVIGGASAAVPLLWLTILAYVSPAGVTGSRALLLWLQWPPVGLVVGGIAWGWLWVGLGAGARLRQWVQARGLAPTAALTRLQAQVGFDELGDRVEWLESSLLAEPYRLVAAWSWRRPFRVGVWIFLRRQWLLTATEGEIESVLRVLVTRARAPGLVLASAGGACGDRLSQAVAWLVRTRAPQSVAWVLAAAIQALRSGIVRVTRAEPLLERAIG